MDRRPAVARVRAALPFAGGWLSIRSNNIYASTGANRDRQMTTVQFYIPDELARAAQQAGLLSSERIAALLQQQLKATQVDALFAAMDRMAAVDEPRVMSPEEVAEELAALRTHRRSGPAD